MASRMHSYPELLADAHTECPSVAGKVVVITGGTTGIGRATAILLASAGADVFICGRSQEHLDDALQRINLLGNGRGMSCDLAQPGVPDQMLRAEDIAVAVHFILTQPRRTSVSLVRVESPLKPE